MKNERIDENLNEIMKKYIEDYLEKKKDKDIETFIVKKSIPIIWFGNIDKYMSSKRKIVTVALNPSKEEFSETRFNIIDFKTCITESNILALKETLCQYFILNPYKSWFSNPESALNALGATYYEKEDFEYTAIHIDFCTAIATDPTWGGLAIFPGVQNKLESFKLFNELLDYLAPDIILFSANKTYFNMAFGSYTLEGERYEKEGNTSSFYVRKFNGNDKSLFWVFNNRGKAFGCSHLFMKQSIIEMMN